MNQRLGDAGRFNIKNIRLEELAGARGLQLERTRAAAVQVAILPDLNAEDISFTRDQGRANPAHIRHTSFQNTPNKAVVRGVRQSVDRCFLVDGAFIPHFLQAGKTR